MNLVTVWCAFGIGHEGVVFKSPEIADAWIRANLIVKELAEADEMPVDEYVQCLIDDRLIGTSKVQLIE